ncbi:MAG: AbgT family transporter [Saprospiraceae bacterium]
MKRHWYDYIPHPVIMLFSILILAAVMTHFLPAGVFEREVIDGQSRVVPGSYHTVTPTPVGIMDLFMALPAGFRTASGVIFVVLTSGIMFGIMERTGTIENIVGRLIHRIGLERRFLLVFLLTYLFGLLGVVVGYENNIAIIPIAAVVSLALGGDLVLAAGLSVGAITVGFGTSPINPYTVGVGHKIAEMPMFSGWWLRSILCFGALTLTAWYNMRYFRRIIKDPKQSLSEGLDTGGLQLSRPLDAYRVSAANGLTALVFALGMGYMLYGIFTYHWSFPQIAAVFVMTSIGIGIVNRMPSKDFSNTALQAVALVAPGAFMVGYATSIKEVLEMGQINDTISHYLSTLLVGLPTTLSAVGMSICQSTINMLIPSGSGQALATLPVMIPLGENLGLTRQVTILAFQIGDGLTNLFNPALGGMIAMLSLCRVPFDRWLRFVLPLTGLLLLFAWLLLVLAVWVGYA